MKLLFCILFLLYLASFQRGTKSRTKIILLGTGTPIADPKRSGSSTAIVVDGIPYIVDCGPGVVRSAIAAGINIRLLNKLFITHLHSDHTAGYPDFVLTPAVMDRIGPLKVFGPIGTSGLNDNILAAYKEDINIRTLGPECGDILSYKVEVKQLVAGIVYKDERLEVCAFNVRHGSWPEAFGFKFTTPDKTIVLSGDCTYSQSVADACSGCDILIHEVYSEEGLLERPKEWQQYHSAFHSSTSQVAEIANQAHPKLLILNHLLLWDSNVDELLKEVRSKYYGKVVCGKDQDVF